LAGPKAQRSLPIIIQASSKVLECKLAQHCGMKFRVQDINHSKGNMTPLSLAGRLRECIAIVLYIGVDVPGQMLAEAGCRTKQTSHQVTAKSMQDITYTMPGPFCIYTTRV
jgi:hypothetical protein